jgi:hypothetical protein
LGEQEVEALIQRLQDCLRMARGEAPGTEVESYALIQLKSARSRRTMRPSNLDHHAGRYENLCSCQLAADGLQRKLR